MFKVYVDEYRYGDAVASTKNALLFDSIEAILEWLSDKDHTVTKDLIRFYTRKGGEFLAVSLCNDIWGEIHMYSISAIEETDGGVIFKRREHMGRRVRQKIAEFKEKLEQKNQFVD